MPPSQELRNEDAADLEPFADESSHLTRGVRGVLIGLAVVLTGVFGLAWKLDPYERDADGKAIGARRQETHRQPPLNLPPCSFYVLTGLPCPSCGMTTSFALLMRGDVVNSLKANAVGTLMALCGLLAVPWALISVCRGRSLFIRSIEKVVAIVIVVLFALMLLRWAIVLVLHYAVGG